MSLKKVQRTRDLEAAGKRQLVAEVAQNQIEEHNFKRLVQAGTIRPCEQNGH